MHLFFNLTFCFATLVDDSFKLDDLETCFQNKEKRIRVLTAFLVQYYSVNEKINFY